MKNYQKLIQIIREANPEKFNKAGFRRYDNISRPIRLEDILIAIKTKGLGINHDGTFIQNGADMGYSWELGKNLDNQSKECKKFLEDILIIKL